MADEPDVEPGCTNFAGMSHGELKKMLETASSSSVGSDAEVWRRARDTLVEIADVLGNATSGAIRRWEGETSAAFQKRMGEIAQSMRETADSADGAYQALVMSSDAIDRAKGEMPEEPSLTDRGLDLLGDGRFFGDDGSAAEKLQEKMASGKSREDAAAELEGDLSEAESRRQKAIVVMQTLSLRYAEARPLLKPPKGRRDGWSETPEDVPSSSSDSPGAVATGAAVLGAGAGFAAADTRRSSTRGGASPSRGTGAPSTTSGGLASPVSPTKVSPGTSISSAGAVTGTGQSPAVGADGTSVSAPRNGVVDGAGGMNRAPNGIVPGGTRMPKSSAGVPSRGKMQNGTESGASRAMTRPMAPGAPAGGISGGRPIPGQNRGTTAKRPGGVVGEEPRTRGGKRVFTSGGTGLAGGRRGVASPGVYGIPRTRTPSAGEEENERRSRPDFLVEDEDTWVPDRTVNPRVVE